MNHHRVFTRISNAAEKSGLRVAYKQGAPWAQRVANLPFFGPSFLNETTLLGTTIYLPSTAWCRQNPEAAWKVLANRMVVAEAVRRWTPPVFFLLYLFPQSLAPLAVLALWKSPWWLLALLAFLPWPAPFRKAVEMRAAAMTMAADYWSGGACLPSPAMIRRFTGRERYFMWPFRRQVNQELLDWGLLITRRKSFGKLPYAAVVKFAIRIETILR